MLRLAKKALSFYLNHICRKTDDATRIREREKPKIWQKDFYILNFINRNISKVFKEYNLLHKDVLDLGCGLKPYRSLMNPNLYLGVDIGLSSASPDIAADLNKPLDLKKKFDVVVLFDSLEHIRNTNQVLETSKTHLKQNGYLILSVPFFYFVHGGPADFYRFTSYYFKDLDTESLELISIVPSNSFISSFLLIANNVVWYPIPFPYFIKYLFYFLMNVIVILIDWLFKLMSKFINNKAFDDFIYMCTLEYFVVYKRK